MARQRHNGGPVPEERHCRSLRFGVPPTFRELSGTWPKCSCSASSRRVGRSVAVRYQNHSVRLWCATVPACATAVLELCSAEVTRGPGEDIERRVGFPCPRYTRSLDYTRSGFFL